MNLADGLAARLRGALALLTLIALLVGTPAVLLAAHAVPSPNDLSTTALATPDDGTVALALITIVAWLSWAVFALSVGLEATARLRGVRPPRLPGLWLPQLTANRLVATAALLFVAVPALTIAGPGAARATPAPSAGQPDAWQTAAARFNAPTSTSSDAPTTSSITAAARPGAAPAGRPASPLPAARTAATVDPDERTGRQPATQPRTAARSTAAGRQQPATEPYTVRRGDSLWKIAETRLGDGTRYTELVTLNRDQLGGRPDFLLPGTVLRVPSPTHHVTATDYVVQPGDTLSGIAEDELGDATAYPQLFDDSTAITQPDGAHLTDPDLIRPGWRIGVPQAAPPPDHSIPEPTRRPPTTTPDTDTSRDTDPNPGWGWTNPATPPSGRDDTNGADSGSPRGEPSIAAPSQPTGSSGDQKRVDTTAGSFEQQAPSWLLPGLAGAGSLLAGSLLLALRQHRRTQLRSRQPGRIIGSPPPETRPAEKSILAAGSTTAPRIEALDRVLRHLAATTDRPRLSTVTLTTSHVRLGLRTPATLAPPWTGHGTQWQVKLDALTPTPDSLRPDDDAPYPMLVSVGQTDDHALVLLDLEALALTAITGHHDRVENLARHLVAELALNPWSTLVEVETLNIGSELTRIAPLRLHHHPDTAQLGSEAPRGSDGRSILARIATVLNAEDHTQEPDPYRAVIAGSAASPEDLRPLRRALTATNGRTGAALITLHLVAAEGDTELQLDDSGRLRCPTLSLDVAAAALTPAEADACARLVELTQDATNAPVPGAAGSPTGYPTDAGGALPGDLTQVRTEEAPGPAALLPLPNQSYEQAGAVTSTDLAALTPPTVDGAADLVETADPDLDEDLATWEAPALLAPKLVLLGPVNARTSGEAHQIARRKPFYVELLSYLVLHPHGVTAHDVADAFGLRPERARSDLSIVRHWLGTDPRTGQPHLPSARTRQTSDEHGAALYRTTGVLSDLDLFRRLRARGQSRGSAGIPDLVAALGLVSGEPFSQLRPAGWTWLLDEERLDHIMTCAIVDVGHILVTHALATGDLDLARSAAESSYGAAPYDETARLDLIAVATASGHEEAAQRQLINDVLNRTDDTMGPTELSERTTQILRQRGWDTTRTRSAG